MTASGRRSLAAGLLAALTLAPGVRADLRADELLLLVNGNVAPSAELAKQYAKARGVPSERMLSLDTPPGEEMTAEVYDSRITAPVRAYLDSPAGKGVRCLVTFYGLPLRVGARAVTPQDRNESEALRKLLPDFDRRAADLARTFDDLAKSVGATAPPGPANTVATAREHVMAIERAIQSQLDTTIDPDRRAAVVAAINAAQQASIASSVEALKLGPATEAVPVGPALAALLNRPRDAASRLAARAAVARQAGLFALQQIVDQQLVWIDGNESDAAVDSELALVRVQDFPRYRWQPNALNWRVSGGDAGNLVMVSRLDAPTPQGVAKMIDDSLATEAAGLDGRAVFDSRGLPPTKDGVPEPYGVYDQTIRDAAAFVKAKTKLTVLTDDREQLIPPRDAPGAAVYCGWYSLRNYVPSCTFVRGAVAYHVASFELVGLHHPREKGWVANLIKDGVVATLGPVSEPYLASFPRPDEFLPLLMTGKPTLAEAYWATTPMTSWKQALIGDPLYRPFARKPAVAVADLPDGVRAWAEKTTGATAIGR